MVIIYVIHNTQSAQISQMQDEHNIYAIKYELPQSHWGDNRKGTLFSWLHILYYVHLASVRFEHSVCRGSIMTIYVMLLAELVEYSLAHWYQPVITMHDVPKCMSYHKAIVVITGRAHCFHDNIYIITDKNGYKTLCPSCNLINSR